MAQMMQDVSFGPIFFPWSCYPCCCCCCCCYGYCGGGGGIVALLELVSKKYLEKKTYLKKSPNDGLPSFGPFIHLTGPLWRVRGLVEGRWRWEERRREGTAWRIENEHVTWFVEGRLNKSRDYVHLKKSIYHLYNKGFYIGFIVFFPQAHAL